MECSSDALLRGKPRSYPWSIRYRLPDTVKYADRYLRHSVLNGFMENAFRNGVHTLIDSVV